jgi:hypothetical protein
MIGQTPYPGVSNLDVLTYLLEGERMAIPSYCPLSMYVTIILC